MTTGSSEQFQLMSVDPPVRGVLHRPAAEEGVPLRVGIVLAHGAGSNANAPLLVAAAEAMAERGMLALRCDLPYRQWRRFGPPGPGDAARDRAGLRNAVAAMRELLGTPEQPEGARGAGKVFLGGHSYGGRQATMLSAEEPELAAGLLLMSYPLHPPRKAEQKRVQHLPKLTTEALFFHGTRDPFGSIVEMEEALKLIPARTKLVAMEGAGHELVAKKGAAGEIGGKIAEEFAMFYGLRGGSRAEV